MAVRIERKIELIVSENEAGTIVDALRDRANLLRHYTAEPSNWTKRADEVDELARRIAQKAGLE